MCLRQGLWVLSAINTVILPNGFAQQGPNDTNNLELNPNKTGESVHTNPELHKPQKGKLYMYTP